MEKEGNAKNLIIILLILIIAVVLFFIVRGIVKENKELAGVNPDLEISEVKKLNDSAVSVKLIQNNQEKEFDGMILIAYDKENNEIARNSLSMQELEASGFEVEINLGNLDNAEKITIAPISISKSGKQTVGKVQDEYILSKELGKVKVTECVIYSQCDDSIKCTIDSCSDGFCLHTKITSCANSDGCCPTGCTSSNDNDCRSSGGGGGGGSGGGGNTDTTCTDTCSSLNYWCGNYTVCGVSVNCGTCSTGYSCQASNSTCMKDNIICTPNCAGKNCGSDGCTGSCGTCSNGYACQANGNCIKEGILQYSPCGDILDYQCGTRNVCNSDINYENCPTGYNCNNNLCIASDSKSCTGVSCSSGEYCSHGVCLMNVSGNTYFVATWGNDNWAGTFEQPWKTWQNAFDNANTGDVVYIRGGVWYPTQFVYHDPLEGYGNNGNYSNPICFFNYPGEKPILDAINFTSTIDEEALLLKNSAYIKLKGLTVRNKKEKIHGHSISAIHTLYTSGYISFENCISHDNGGYGFSFGGFETIYVTNCDSYNNADILSDDPGNRADGFNMGAGGTEFDLFRTISFNGCRAWNNSDDGFDIGTSKQVKISHSWSFNNGYLPYGGGVGFKFGPSNVQDPYKRIVYNTIAAGNNYDGYAYQNLNNELVGPVGAFYNNLAYRCSMGFTSDVGSFNCDLGYTKSIYRNNAVFQSTYGVVNGNYPSAYDQGYLSLCRWNYQNYSESNFVQENNTWISATEPPFWEYNPFITVSDADFVSLDTSQLMKPRKADGSLPEITFGHLAQGSDLIDAGMIIPDYHCVTGGAHPGQNCREWYGSAPDLGAFESNY